MKMQNKVNEIEHHGDGVHYDDDDIHEEHTASQTTFGAAVGSDEDDGFSIRKAMIDSFGDEYASILIFIRLIFLHVESYLAATIAVVSPCFYHYYVLDGRNLEFSLSWTMVSTQAYSAFL